MIYLHGLMLGEKQEDTNQDVMKYVLFEGSTSKLSFHSRFLHYDLIH